MTVICSGTLSMEGSPMVAGAAKRSPGLYAISVDTSLLGDRCIANCLNFDIHVSILSWSYNRMLMVHTLHTTNLCFCSCSVLLHIIARSTTGDVHTHFFCHAQEEGTAASGPAGIKCGRAPGCCAGNAECHAQAMAWGHLCFWRKVSASLCTADGAWYLSLEHSFFLNICYCSKTW